jgi:putative endopeptidase
MLKFYKPNICFMKKIFFVTSLIIFSIIGLSSCHHPKISQGTDALASHIDSAVKPGTDFFEFANGKWFKQNPIPGSEQSNGIWQLIQDTINAQIRKVCESSAKLKNEPKGSNKQKIGDFFFTGMDSVSLNKKAMSDLKGDFDAIDAIKDIPGLIKEASFIHMVAGSPLFGFYVGQDDKKSSKIAVFVAQGGLSLPDRNYYFDNDSRAVTVRQKFVIHLENIFGLMGYATDKAKASAAKMMALETAIAKTSRKREDLRDPWANYNKMTFKQIGELTPNIEWKIFMDGVGLRNVDSVIVGQPEFLKAMNGYLKSYTLDQWKDYLKYHLIRGLGSNMDDKTYKDFFDFYSATLRGVKEPKPRWKRVVEETDGCLGELIGQIYVDEYLPKGTKEKLVEIGNAIKTVFAERIKGLDWMSQTTKDKALAKLNAIIMKVGYPDKWKDLSSMQIDRTSFVKNVMAANKWETGYMISKYGKPVDRTEWDMEPQTYNAYYNPSNNEIVIPGCNIIVPGYEGKLADDALLYSIIGATFGHEMTHGFDDQGCKYNAQGNLQNWWTAEDSAKFFTKTKMIVKQFNKYVAVDSLHINGELTQGENIADLGGIIMAYVAFQKTDQFKKNQNIAGMTPTQRFFLGYALAWMVNMRPEAVANQVKSNEHAPAKFRVNGPLSDMPEFYEAFNVKQGDPMWLPDSLRVKIW